MTRKDYQLIASVLANYSAEGGVTIERDEVAQLLADALGADNPRFDRNKFLIASGVYSAKIKHTLSTCDVDRCNDAMRYVTGQGQWCEAHLPEWAKKIKSQISSVA